LGASVADWLGKPRNVGGLGLGSGWVALILTALIAIVVAYLAVSKRDVQVDATTSIRVSRAA
jgi:uncharacterized membrane-anchored protein